MSSDDGFYKIEDVPLPPDDGSDVADRDLSFTAPGCFRLTEESLSDIAEHLGCNSSHHTLLRYLTRFHGLVSHLLGGSSFLIYGPRGHLVEFAELVTRITGEVYHLEI